MSDANIGVALLTIVVAIFIALLVTLALGKGNQRYQGHYSNAPVSQTR